MKNYNFLFILLFIPGLLHAQQVERKVIVSKGMYYYTTIDAEFQVATLHFGKTSESMNAAQKRQLPAGRNYNEPVIPFSWDMSDHYFYAVNFLEHSLNDRNEAIKRISLTTLLNGSENISIPDLIMISAERNTFVLNDPYRFVISKSNTMNGFFFDAISTNDSSFYMAITNNGEFSLWNYNGKEWKHSPLAGFTPDGFFSIVHCNGAIFMIANNGSLLKLSLDKAPEVVRTSALGDFKLSEGTIVEDRDHGKVYFIKNDQINPAISIDELISKNVIAIF